MCTCRDLRDAIIRYCNQACRSFVLGLVVKWPRARLDLRRSLGEDHASVLVVQAVWRHMTVLGHTGAQIFTDLNFAQVEVVEPDHLRAISSLATENLEHARRSRGAVAGDKVVMFCRPAGKNGGIG